MTYILTVAKMYLPVFGSGGEGGGHKHHFLLSPFFNFILIKLKHFEMGEGVTICNLYTREKKNDLN